MIAFILAGLCVRRYVHMVCFLTFAAGMSSSPGAAADVPIVSSFVIGTIVAVLIAASHWLPKMGW